MKDAIIMNGKFLGFIHDSLSCRTPNFSFSASSCMILRIFRQVRAMPIKMKAVIMAQLEASHVDRPTKEGKFGVPLKRFTRKHRPVSPRNCRCSLHCEHVELSRS